MLRCYHAMDLCQWLIFCCLSCMPSSLFALRLAWPAAEVVQTSQGDNRQRDQGHGDEHARQPHRIPHKAIQAGADGTRAEIDGEVQAVTARAFGAVEQVSHAIEQDRGRAIEKESEAEEQGQQPYL